MTTFHDLFRQPTRKVGDTFPPDRRDELFPGLVERSRKLHLWSPGQPTSERGPRLLIGVATWSGYDLNLLDLIEEAIHGPVRIDVFNIASLGRDPAGLARYIPELEPAPQTPYVGLWNDGRLVEAGCGYDGRQVVARVCNLDPAEVEDRMKTILTRF